MTKDTILQNIAKRLVRNGCTPVCFGAHSSSLRGALKTMLLLLLTLGTTTVWGQTPKVSDGIYYIRNNATNKGYLWPSLTTNTTTGYRYLTTSLATSVDANVNTNGVSYPAHDKSYSHWVVKNVTGGYIQLINPRLNKYVVVRKFPKENNNSQNAWGDRDVWLTDEPAAGDVEYSYFVLNNNNSPYKISPKPGLNDIANTSGYTFNSASGNDREWLTWSKSDNKPQNGEGREGLIQLYSGNPQWAFTSDLLDAPTISDVDANSMVTVTDANGLPDGYHIRYTTDDTNPTANSPIMEDRSLMVMSSLTLKAVVERYGIVLTAVASKTLEPAPCATPVITYDNTTSKVSITCTTAGNTIYYTTNGSDPTTSSTEYSESFSVTSPTTVKAIATHATFAPSAVAVLEISQVVTPTIQNNGSNAISITTTTPDATIYYTTDGSDPTISDTEYEGPLTDNVSNVNIKAIAVKEGMINSIVGSGTVMLQCAAPVITRDDMTFILSCSMPTDATFYYSLDGSTPATVYNGPVSFTSGQLPMTVTAVARHSNYTDSETSSLELKNGSGTSADPYLIYGATDLANFVTNVNAGTTSSAYYKLEVDVSGSSAGVISNAFTGTFDGGMHTISNLGHALFNTVNGGVVKNVILDNVSISSGTNVGAICNEATGASRIYNCGILATNSTVEKDEDGYDYISSCSSTITGSGYVGSIVGLLDGSSRVINCFSYANVSGDSYVGGIVGYNNVATTANNLQTMVMNCMFYGEVSGSSIAPIYNGTIITNDGDAKGVNNFNYFRLESSYIQNTEITKVYHCALGAETRFLQRFEFFRHLLNSNRELAAWWATDDVDNKDEMMKWVMEPTQIGTTTPYPILKTPDKYASVVNYTPSTTAYDETNRNKGLKLTSEGDGGVLHVTIQMGSGGAHFSAPSGAGLKSGETGMFDLTITDKDFEHFNFNYGKVQLPYYNDYCDGNYTGDRVVTGWKITGITGGTAGSYSIGASNAPADVTYTDGELTATPYNFADRKCTEKDLYGTSGRVFNQGAYWDVPEGVTAITIEPYWGKAVYLADAYWDVTYKNSGTDAMATAANVTTIGGGQRYGNGETFNGQTVYTSIGDAIATAVLYESLSENDQSARSVYDYAVVLVGNYHHTGSIAGGGKPYTVTSVDLDGDNEPDYSFILRFNKRVSFHPVRYDFLNLIGLGMAQKTTGGTGSYNLGIMQPKYWFEVTNTALFRVTQFEYSQKDRVKNPYILQGGVIEQWVTQQQSAGDKVNYFHVGGNVWFKEFHRGSHQDNPDRNTPHPPVSVTGGDFAKFYLTGLYQSQAAIYNDNAECYINGGRFGEIAGAGMEGIGTSDGKGNVTWVIDNADIKEFYGGGINYDKPVHGNIHTIISNSHVDIFCGGPKFGDMVDGRTVTTTATNCIFGTYFGAGYGGNSYSRYPPYNYNNVTNIEWNDWVNGEIHALKDDNSDPDPDYVGYQQDYSSTYNGVSTQIAYQFLPMSGNTDNCARLWIEYVSFSLAKTHNVTSSLSKCTITGNFYGGGSLGKVEGNVTSTLSNCTVDGNVFGAGYGDKLPTVEVMNTGGFRTEPYYYTDLGTYRTAVLPTTKTYTWQHRDEVNSTETAINKTDQILYTTEDLTQLGTVTGDVTLTIIGDDTLIKGDVYGGGARSKTNLNTDTDEIKLTTVNLLGGKINGDAYGGGLGSLGVQNATNPTVYDEDPVAADVGNTKLNLNGMDSGYDTKSGWGLVQDGSSYTVADSKKGCIVAGDIFGCNNLNGTPKGTVTVHVYKTQRVGATRITNTESVTNAKVKGTPGDPSSYDVKHVYGGGNLAAYEPTNALSNNIHTTVIIDGCDRTSIYQVYGGGNAASTPATEVNINGTFEIEEAFGGGNGKDAITINGVTKPNPGANVGFKDYSSVESTYPTKDSRQTEEFISAYTYGTGEAKMNIHGGKVHRVYGGSNTKGNVRISAVTMLEEESDCPFDVDEAYGGGKSAPMDGASNLIMACIPGLKAAYGGAEDANIEGDVSLNITNGYFDRVFGGNNVSGSIKGTITVNIEETGCKPIVIGQLYGGGNLAPYTAPTGQHGPTLNVRSFTSIGEIYGGGYGSTAIVTGDPYVNINVCDGMDYSSNSSLVSAVATEIAKRATITFNEYVIENGQLKLDDNGNRIPVKKTVSLNMPTRTGLMGAIHKVFGGGNAANVVGSTHVNIGTTSNEVFVTPITKVVNGTTVATTETERTKTVRGADVRGDVYGGGNAAEVTGDTNVVIGK